MKFGAHVSIAGGIFNAPQNGKKATCDVVQIFSKNQMQWRVPNLSDADIEKFKSEEARTGIKAVCIHASYLINLGSFDTQKLKQSRANFIIEMQRSEALGIPYLIVHPGSHTGNGEGKGLQRIAESLNFVLDKFPNFKSKILLETTAGQGDNLGYTFEQLAKIQSLVDVKEKIGVCVDTCHIFAAGYELRSADGYQKTMTQLDEIIGIVQVGIIHANDSKREIGRKIDRHEHIGNGELGLVAFDHLVNDARLQDIPMIIETPAGHNKDIENLQKLRNLIN
ncbi:MAG: deoxyribonuclease IV [bacterium]